MSVRTTDIYVVLGARLKGADDIETLKVDPESAFKSTFMYPKVWLNPSLVLILIL